MKLEDNEEMKIVWMFFVDMDNNGKYDIYILYSILFCSFSCNSDGKFECVRNLLEVRMLLMVEVKIILDRC